MEHEQGLGTHLGKGQGKDQGKDQGMTDRPSRYSRKSRLVPMLLCVLALNLPVPVQAAPDTVQTRTPGNIGIERGTMRRIQGGLNPALDIEGVLLTMYDDRTNLGQLVARDVREFFKYKVFNTMIPRNVRLGEAPSHGTPGVLYDSKSRGAAAYVALAKEMLSRYAAA